jgi:ATP-dependent Lhr-like helicase
MLSSKGVREALSQAVLDSPMFTARWRWNLGRSLAVLRMKGGKKNPAPIQRMESDDLMAAIFPTLAACQEHQAGPIEIPDQPIVNQTLDDCLNEAMDIEALAALFRDLEQKRVRVHSVDTTEPSPLTHEILGARPYTFLDNAPLEERRTRAVALRRGLPDDARDLARLDPEAIALVREQARPSPRSTDELHELLTALRVCPPDPLWEPWLEALVKDGRALVFDTERGRRWAASECWPSLRVLFPAARPVPEPKLPAALEKAPLPTQEQAAVEMLRGHLDCSGPATIDELAVQTALSAIHVEQAVARLEAEGFLLRGRFEPERGAEQVCARRLLARIHRQTQERLRREIEPVTAQDLMRFLLRWQHVLPETRREGRRGTLAVVEQLQGFEVAAGAWEESVLPARVAGYQSAWLDDLCLSGEVVWGRLSPGPPRESAPARRGAVAPSRATPITLAVRDDVEWLLTVARGDAEPGPPDAGAAAELLACLTERGALFFSELAGATGRLPVEVEQGLWDLVSRGLVAADGFQSVRALLGSRERGGGRRPSERRGRLRRGARGRVGREGRWALLRPGATGIAPAPRSFERDELAEAVAEQLLARWGVVFRDLATREGLALPWREVVWALRRLEARGSVRGGRFITGFTGEQYALPGAVDALRRTRRMPRDGTLVRLSGADPLNLVGTIVPGQRIPALRSRSVAYRDGLPVEAAELAGGLRSARP